MTTYVHNDMSSLPAAVNSYVAFAEWNSTTACSVVRK